EITVRNRFSWTFLWKSPKNKPGDETAALERLYPASASLTPWRDDLPVRDPVYALLRQFDIVRVCVKVLHAMQRLADREECALNPALHFRRPSACACLPRRIDMLPRLRE